MLFDNNAIIAERYFSNTLGILIEGAAADIIITDYNPPTPMNGDNVNSHVLFGMSGRSVITTMCNGKVLMKDRVLSEIDEEAEWAHIREEAQILSDDINS